MYPGIQIDSVNGVVIVEQGHGTSTPGTFAALFKSLSDTPQQFFKAFLGCEDRAAQFNDPQRTVTICSGLNGVAITYAPAAPWPMGVLTPDCVWKALDILNARVAALESAP